MTIYWTEKKNALSYINCAKLICFGIVAWCVYKIIIITQLMLHLETWSHCAINSVIQYFLVFSFYRKFILVGHDCTEIGDLRADGVDISARWQATLEQTVVEPPGWNALVQWPLRVAPPSCEGQKVCQGSFSSFSLWVNVIWEKTIRSGSICSVVFKLPFLK
jgi:hypothetical protein